jgi:transposase-like protein
MVKLKCPYCGNEYLYTVENNIIVASTCPACGGQMEILEQIENMEAPLYPFLPSGRAVIDTAYSKSISFTEEDCQRLFRL